ncbi:gas vesicle protein GvpG [Streptomyces capparidis]|jgi:hypothetical protein
MGLISGVLLAPLAPVRAVVWLAEQLREAGLRELYDPESIRRRLEQVEEARQSGDLSEEEAAREEEELVARLMASAGAGLPGGGPPGGVPEV